jgi:2'-5' RNA ligase
VKRLFIAVDLDERTRDEVAQVVLRIKSHVTSRVTWVQPDRLHLTLAFLGNADPALELTAMAAVAFPVDIPPFDLAFSELGVFPPKGPPRVLWLGIRQGLDGLRRLHAVVQERLGVASPEPYHPHLTLARFRDRMSRGDLAKLLEISASAGPCRIDRVTLYESRLSPKGPAYSVLAQAPISPCT